MFETTTLTSRLTRRPRRLRTSETIRDLVRETTLTPQKLVLPLFIIEGRDRHEPIEAMPGRARLSIDLAVDECRRAVERLHGRISDTRLFRATTLSAPGSASWRVAL